MRKIRIDSMYVSERNSSMIEMSNELLSTWSFDFSFGLPFIGFLEHLIMVKRAVGNALSDLTKTNIF